MTTRTGQYAFVSESRFNIVLFVAPALGAVPQSVTVFGAGRSVNGYGVGVVATLSADGTYAVRHTVVARSRRAVCSADKALLSPAAGGRAYIPVMCRGNRIGFIFVIALRTFMKVISVLRAGRRNNRYGIVMPCGRDVIAGIFVLAVFAGIGRISACGAGCRRDDRFISVLKLNRNSGIAFAAIIAVVSCVARIFASCRNRSLLLFPIVSDSGNFDRLRAAASVFADKIRISVLRAGCRLIGLIRV